jgi:hypothetical protein
MTVRRFNTANPTTRTVAQRRRVHAARLRTAEMRARLATPRSEAARQYLAGPNHVPDAAAG